MIDWTKSMQQSFEFYTVDPGTWRDNQQIMTIESCTVNRDEGNETLGSATFDSSEPLDECYLRVYLIVNQNGEHGKFPLGTFLVQTPEENFDGKKQNVSLDAYTPLIELKEGIPPLGYSVLKGTEIMPLAFVLTQEKVRAPVVPTKNRETLYADFVSNTNDNWMTFLTDLIANANFKFALDDLGRILYEPIQDVASLQSVYTFDDGNSSILYPSMKNKRDLYGIPNVVEVVKSNSESYLFSRIVNDDPDSPVSTVNRGREIIYRESNPSIPGQATQEMVDDYAYQLLRNMSTLEHALTYTHGYCPVRVGDCVTLHYKNAGLQYVKAKVVSQSIKCSVGCSVEETAVYTEKLWR